MKHGRKVPKLQRDAAHRKALLANLVCALVEHRRIRTTLAKAKAVRPLAEKMITLGKRGDLHARRTAISELRQTGTVKKLFEDIAPASKDRQGGYTRIIKLGQRRSDSAPMAFIEWVDAYVPPAPKSEEAAAEVVTVEEPAAAEEAAPKKKRATKKAAEAAAE
ncbi:MAG TPA: 50S ribosomal protein L17 [Verrucomicrobiales bacterium]|nr:50S ribosomal protein L17 [Verrucomicrobiales bacterium]